jgi:anti-sigma B factor antagonist
VYESASGRLVIKINGDLDFDSADAFVDTVKGVLAGAGGASVDVDLSGLDFLDSSGIRALLQAHRACVSQGGSLSVSGARGLIAEVLHITAVDELLGVTTRRGPSTGRPPAPGDGGTPPE